MAGSSQTKSSPKGKRKDKAAAAAATKSVDVNEEDYGVRSPERTQLLAQIKAKLNNDPVNPAFWACCQLAHMNCLEDVANSPRNDSLYREANARSTDAM
jgi:hypothetical protein